MGHRNRFIKGAIGIALLGMFLFSPLAFAQRDTPIVDLERSGIRYQDGFDINTVGEVKGIVNHVYAPDSGPVQIVLSNRFDKYIAIIAPKWYLEDIALSIQEGQEVRIRGSKGLGKDGNLYILAQEIVLTSNGRSFVFRSQSGSPLWSSGALRGAGGSMGRQGGGGFRGGFGGQGRR